MDITYFPFGSFDWDVGNHNKNRLKHGVSIEECEQVFHNKPLLISLDSKHSQQETRYHALGKTDEERRLKLAFTLRNDRIRIISARDMSRNERKHYEEAEIEAHPDILH